MCLRFSLYDMAASFVSFFTRGDRVSFVSKDKVSSPSLSSATLHICRQLTCLVLVRVFCSYPCNISWQTFREKKKNIPEGTLRFDLHKRANASLHSGIDLRQVVRLPPEEDLNDWIAVHGGHMNSGTGCQENALAHLAQRNYVLLYLHM